MCLSSLWKEFRDKLFRDVSYSVHNISRNNKTKATISRGSKEQYRIGMLWGQNISEQ